MPHKLTGLWRSMLFPKGSTKPVSDGTIFLRINESNGKVDTGSNHDGKTLTGEAKSTADGLRLTLKQEESDNVRDQSGLLASEEDTISQKNLVIIGQYKDTAIVVTGDRDKKKEEPEGAPAPPPPQDEGVWVITKP